MQRASGSETSKQAARSARIPRAGERRPEAGIPLDSRRPRLPLPARLLVIGAAARSLAECVGRGAHNEAKWA